MNAEGRPAKISVVTATLNSEADLPRLLDSLRAQTDSQFDLVIVDGNSTDGTWSIVQSYRDIVTRTLREDDFGLYDALNKGIRASEADYYLVLGSDDILFPDAIARYKEAIQSGAVDVVVASVLANGRIRSGFHKNRAWLGHPAMVTSHSVGMLFRTKLHERFGYYSSRYPLLADGLFIKRVCLANDVNVASADFVAGEFGMRGSSNRNLVRVLCESWQIQLDTGESATVQYLLFQFRLLKNLPHILLTTASNK